MKATKFKKAYSRDFSIFMEYFWNKALLEGLKEKFNWTITPKVMCINYINDGIIEIWENEDVHKALIRELSTLSNEQTELINEVISDYEHRLDKNISPVIKKGRLESLPKLLEFIDEAEETMKLFIVWYFLTMANKAEKEIKKKCLELRDKDSFFDDVDRVIRRSMLYIYPELEGCEMAVFPDELRKEKFPSINILKQRRKNYVFIYKEYQDIISIEEFCKNNKKYSLDLNTDDIQKFKGVLKGSTAFLGNIEGIVKVIRLRSEINKMKKGYILVTPMTTPDFVPAMKMAKGIITDDGGIICHAAILSRELKIPCVVGTKIASKVLKDGDKVSMKNGVIRLIKE